MKGKTPAVVLVLAVTTLALSSLPVWAQQSDPQEGDVIFTDSFEEWKDANQRVESTWSTWSRSDCDLVWDGDVNDVCRSPEYKQASPMGAYPYRVHSGANAQQYFSFYAGHHAGIWKQFAVAPGTVIEVHSWGQAWSSGEDDDPHQSDAGADVRMKIGVDPYGGSDPACPSVVWGNAGNPLDVWHEVPPVEVTAGDAGKVTIFLSSNPNYPVKHNDIYWDDVYAKFKGMETPDLPAETAGPAQSGTGGNPAVTATPPDPILDGMVEGDGQPGKGGDAGWVWLALLVAVGGAVLTLDRIRGHA